MPALEVQRWGIPDELLQIDAWAVWRYEADERGHVSKPPYCAFDPMVRAYATAPETWSPFELAWQCYQSHRSWLSGVSFALSDWGIVGVDLDHVSEDLATAAVICELLDSYTEITPGRDGFRIFVHGYLPPGRRVRERIEVYQAKRFLTVTGQRIDRFPPVLQDRQLELERVWSEFVSYVAA